jgi:hypothetical protein
VARLSDGNHAVGIGVFDLGGSYRTSRSGGTNTAINPLTSTPNPRKGRAWTKTPQNTVPAVANAPLLATAARSHAPKIAKATKPKTRTSMDPTRGRRAARI